MKVERNKKGQFVKNVRAYKPGEFKKGQKAFNKGLKQEDYMSPEAIERTKATRFKKGQMPPNYRPVGSTRITVDGYMEIKTSDKPRWELYHKYIYEKEYGPIPKGHIIAHLDSDKLNNNLNNLIAISRGVHALMCNMGYYTTDPELTLLCIRYVESLRAVNNKKKKEK